MEGKSGKPIPKSPQKLNISLYCYIFLAITKDYDFICRLIALTLNVPNNKNATTRPPEIIAIHNAFLEAQSQTKSLILNKKTSNAARLIIPAFISHPKTFKPFFLTIITSLAMFVQLLKLSQTTQ